MMSDQDYMQRCLDLAVLGGGTTSPNPMVGAVIVFQDQIIGEGFTSPYGGAHAEVNAVNQAVERYGETQAKAMFREATIYVSLEPCAHFGKTPPCADLLVNMGFQKAVIACLDPFAKVNGAGLKKLQDAGMETEVGLLEKQAKWINRRFFTKLEKSRPYIILKWAQTADGFFAPLEDAQKWISNIASKQVVHKWRAEEDAILVGKNTAILDNPSLTVRDWKGTNPKRILIDKNLAVPQDFAILNDQAETIVFNAVKTEWQGHLKFVELENFDLYLPQQIPYQLYLMDVQSIIIEGGKKTLDMFIDAGLWDEARIFRSAETWSDGIPAPHIEGEEWNLVKVGSDSFQTLIHS